MTKRSIVDNSEQSQLCRQLRLLQRRQERISKAVKHTIAQLEYQESFVNRLNHRLLMIESHASFAIEGEAQPLPRDHLWRRK